MVCDNFIKYSLSNGGILIPLVFDTGNSDVVGLCNPSIFKTSSGIKIIIRGVNYMLWKSEVESRFTSKYGPLCYITPDNDNHLRTWNFICDFNNDSIGEPHIINTNNFDSEPLWDFVGLEDARLVEWDNKLYVTGVRRDTTENGVGRMELCEIDRVDYKEISRLRIDSPYGEDIYCEKNWMPIVDMPYHYVRWCNPLEIVKINPLDGTSEIVIKKEYNQSIENLNYNETEIRGSSQIVNVGDYRVAIVHRCEMWVNEKGEKSQSKYVENFIVWDNEWNIVKISKPFNFGSFDIEFTNGLLYDNGYYYIPFALQDNMSYVLKIDDTTVNNFIFRDYFKCSDYILNGNELIEFFNDTKDSYQCKNLGDIYYKNKQFSAAMVLYQRAVTYNTFKTHEECYQAMYMTGKCLDDTVDRMEHLPTVWCNMINLLPYRSEGYYFMAWYYLLNGSIAEAYTFIQMTRKTNNFGYLGEFSNITKYDVEILYIQILYGTEHYLECETYIDKLIKDEREKIPNDRLEEIINLLLILQNNKNNKKRML